jgi:hypothetical protein
MATFKDIIDYDSAPLVQWEPAIGEAPSGGKIIEDDITHGAIASWLKRKKISTVADLIADEARLSLRVAQENPKTTIKHITLSGAFEQAAHHNLAQSAVNNVEVITDIAPELYGQQDAVVMNMILGCVATGQDQQNIGKLLGFARDLLKDDGSLLLIRPNPAGGAFSTYQCLTAADELKAGQDYDFMVTGLEEYGAMQNLYTPNTYLKNAFADAGLTLGKTRGLGKQISGNGAPAFLMNIGRPA